MCYSCFFFILFILILRPPISTLFPYTTLFRSWRYLGRHAGRVPRVPDRALRPSSHPRLCLQSLRRRRWERPARHGDRKSTRLNSSHSQNSYAVFCLKKKNQMNAQQPSSHTHKVKVDSVLHVLFVFFLYFIYIDTATTDIYTLSLHDALPILAIPRSARWSCSSRT